MKTAGEQPDQREQGRAHDGAEPSAPQRVARDAQDRLMVKVSHDLRNPLNTIVTGAESLQQAQAAGAPPERVQRITDLILRAARRMSGLLGDFVALSSLEAGRLSVTTLPEAPQGVVAEALARVRPAAEAKALTLRVEQPLSLPNVRCDRDRLLQAFICLLGNAIAVTPRRGTVAITVEALSTHVHFAVQDGGPGLQPSDAQHIFEAYWRSPTSKYPGTGVGLAMARGLIEEQDGELWVDPSAGPGATFHFTVPVASEAQPRRHPDPSSPRPG